MDRINEDIEDFLAIAKGKFFALEADKMKPQLQMKTSPDRAKNKNIEDQWAMLQRSMLGDETLFREGKILVANKRENEKGQLYKKTNTQKTLQFVTDKLKSRAQSVLKFPVGTISQADKKSVIDGPEKSVYGGTQTVKTEDLGPEQK